MILIVDVPLKVSPEIIGKLRVKQLDGLNSAEAQYRLASWLILLCIHELGQRSTVKFAFTQTALVRDRSSEPA